MDSPHSTSISQHPALLDFLTRCQCFLIKSHLVDMDNRFNRIFPSFTPLHSELSPGHRVIDNFSDQLVFNLHGKQNGNKTCTQQLDNTIIKLLNSFSTTIVVTDASIKNNIATSISHMHIYNNSIAKTVYYVIYVTSTKAELFAIRCGINQASNHNGISKIIVITNSIHAAKKIFNPSLHSFQVHSVAILTEL